MSANNKFIGGAFLQKELQGFSGFLAYQECFRRGTSSTKGTLEASLGEQFFGNPSDVDSIGLAEQLVKGVGVFAGLYTVEEPDTMPLLVTDVRANQSPLPILVLKPELHCLGGDKRVVVGTPNGINLSLLYSRSLRSTATQNTTVGAAPASAMLANRTILCRAQDHLKNGKKALAIVLASDSPYKAYASNGTLPSGMSLQDYYMYIRRKMYILLLNNSASFVDGTSTNDELVPSALGTTNEDHGTEDRFQESPGGIGDEEEASEDAMPESWTFPGFIIFALMGPIVPDGIAAYRSELFMTSPQVNAESSKATPSNNGTPAGGRNSARKQAAADAASRRRVKDKPNDRRDSSTSSSAEIHSGITLDQRIHVAAIAQSRMANLGKERSRIHDRILSRHRQKVKDMKSLINGHKFLISETEPNDPKRPSYIEEFKSMNKELAQIMSELAKAEDKVINEEQEMYLNHQIPADDFIDLTIATVAGNQVGLHGMESSFKQTSRKKAKFDEECSRASPFAIPVSAAEQTLTTSSASQFTVSSVEIDVLSSVSPMNESIIAQVEKGENDSQKKNVI